MNRPIFEKNIEALEKKYPVWADIVRTRNRKKKNFDVVIEQSYTDEPIMRVTDHGKTYYLNGKYAPSEVAVHWLRQQKSIEPFATIIIIGLSNGVHIQKIMESIPKTASILVYEPSYEIFRRAMEEVDLTFLFQPDIPVGILIPAINGFEQVRYFSYLITYDNMVALKIFVSGNYNKLFKNEISEFVEALKKYMERMHVGWATLLRYTDINAGNVFHNMHYLYEGYSVADLKDILPADVPAIIVSAGPSLNKNIKDLKAAVGRACIIATDTAMKPLLNEGIVPDLFVIVDGLKPAELFEHKGISKSGMVTMTGVSTEPMNMHKGKKYFYTGDCEYETELLRNISSMKDRSVLLPALPTGGSVANNAYSLGVYMGAKTIILVGQDLALTGNKVHVDGAFKDEICEIDLNSTRFSEIEAVGGGTVITRNDFKFYLDWFEKTIKTWSRILTIDATEGGALIHGAKNMTLKRAIKKYCTKKYNAKWHIARIPKIFQTAEEKKFALQYFENSSDKLVEIREKAKEGIEYYEELQKLITEDPNDNKKIADIYEKIKETNLFMEKDAMAETVMDSLEGVQYTLRPTIYQFQEKKEDEINDVAKQGKLMLATIYYASDELKTIVEKTLIPYTKKQLELQKEEV